MVSGLSMYVLLADVFEAVDLCTNVTIGVCADDAPLTVCGEVGAPATDVSCTVPELFVSP